MEIEKDTSLTNATEDDNDTIIFDENICFNKLLQKKDHISQNRRFQSANWKLLVRAHYNEDAKRQCIGVFVGVDKPYLTTPQGWLRKISFQYILVNEDETKNVESIRHSSFCFDRRDATPTVSFLDQGFNNAFPKIDLGTIFKKENGFVNNQGEIVIRTVLEVVFERTRPPLNHNPKLATGMVGLENLGATCYLNALLQMLFHLSAFRKAVYLLPVVQDVPVDGSTTLALQSVFHDLQVHDSEVSTRALTKAFGWTSADAFMQQDVQEMMRVLLDKLEEKMAGTEVDGEIKRLFCGQLRSFIRCVDVTYESARDEDYYDLQLDVKGCKDVKESFTRYIEKELLSGDNKYDAGPEFGKQDAQKGVMFMNFPPVLTIHLKRFAFDFQRMGFTKVHDHYEFPVVLDLNEFLSPDADEEVKKINHTYELHSVLVHSGDVHGGHYYAYIRPANKHKYGECLDAEGKPLPGVEKAGKWYMFNDENVYEVHKKEAVDLCFGNKTNGNMPVGIEKFASAYMLVYIRVDSGIEAMKPMECIEEVIPSALSLKFDGHKKKELIERRARLIEDSFTDVYYWLESDIAYFSQYYEGLGNGDLLSPATKRKLIIPRKSSYLTIYLRLLEDLDLKPWQLFIFPFQHNVDNLTSVQMQNSPHRTVFPIKALEDVEWFYNNMGNCRYLNAVPDNSYVYVHITNQFDKTKEINLVDIEAKYVQFRAYEAELRKKIVAACSVPNAFADEALNCEPFDYAYGCGLGAHNWPLHCLANPIAGLIENTYTKQKDFCFNAVIAPIYQLVCYKRLLFFKTYDPTGQIPFIWSPPALGSLLTSEMMCRSGRVMRDYYGDYVSEQHFDDDVEVDEELVGEEKRNMKLKLLLKKAKTKFDSQLSGAKSPSLKIRYIGSYFIDIDRKIGALAKICAIFTIKAYDFMRDLSLSNLPAVEALWIGATNKDGSSGSLQDRIRDALSEERVRHFVPNYWSVKEINLFSLTFPSQYCVYSPDIENVDVYTNKSMPNASIPLSEMTIGEYCGASSATSNILYAEHYSEEVMASQFSKEIVNISGYNLEDLTVLNYLSYRFYVRKYALKPDKDIRGVLTALSLDSSKPNKKKRSRTTLTTGERDDEHLSGPDGVEVEDEEVEIDLNVDGDGDAVMPVEDVLTRKFTVGDIEINCNISCRCLFDTLAKQIPGGCIDPDRLVLVPANSKSNAAHISNPVANPYYYGGYGAFMWEHSINVPPLLPLDYNFFKSLAERKYRKMDTFIFRPTPFKTTISPSDGDSDNLGGVQKTMSLFDAQIRQMEVTIGDYRLLAFRKHFLSLFHIFNSTSKSNVASPGHAGLGVAVADDEEAVVSGLMRNSINSDEVVSKKQRAGSGLNNNCPVGSVIDGASALQHRASSYPLAILQVVSETTTTTISTSVTPNNVGESVVSYPENRPQPPSAIVSKKCSTNFDLDCTYMEDLYGLLWPVSLTAALPKEFISTSKIYIKVDLKKGDDSISNVCKMLRNAVGVPVYTSADRNVSDVQRFSLGTQSNTDSLDRTEVIGKSTGDAVRTEGAYTVTTTTNVECVTSTAKYVVATPYVSNPAHDNKWLNSIQDWISWNVSDASVESSVLSSTSDSADVATCIKQVALFLKQSTLLLYHYDENGVIVAVYSDEDSTVGAIPKSWMDIPTAVGHEMAVAAAEATQVNTNRSLTARPLQFQSNVPKAEYSPEASFIAMQFFSDVEELYCRSAHPTVRSIGAMIYNFQPLKFPSSTLHTFHHKWVTLDPQLYGEPLVSYITEHDTVESITHRVSAMSGIPLNEIRLAFLKTVDIVPSYLPRLPGATEANAETSSQIKGSDPTAPKPYDPDHDSIWSYLSFTYPDAVMSVDKRRQKLEQLQHQHQQQQGHANVHPPPPPPPSVELGTLPVYFPLIIGIERETIAATATSPGVSRHRNSVKKSHMGHSSIKIN